MKLAGIIVTYMPDVQDLINNIDSCVNDLDYLILWENTPREMIRYDRDFFLERFPNKISFAGTGENVGIGKALNYGARIATENGYTHLLTMDQDSYFEIDHLSRYKEQILTCHYTSVGIFGVNYRNNDCDTFSKASRYLEQPDCITSGSIIAVETFHKTGLFNENLFIDAVDFDFCYNIKKKCNLITMICTEISLFHKIGYGSKTRWGFYTDNYSPMRTYFIVRNQLLMWFKYPEQFPNTRKKFLIKDYILMRIVKVLLAEDQKIKKLSAIYFGVLDALLRNEKKRRYFNG
ncbi:hypothetical protein ACFSQ3_03855 [Sphingobacterium corticis]|uniref:Rhamnosyltransferase n=1 Tax=Sphingobacterium corticis TaxID=1812823 RepID=A0ABW5NHQ7_9SPHI